MTSQSKTPPNNYEDLCKTLNDRHDGLTKTYQKIARYVTQHPNDVAMLSVHALSTRCGVHASSLVRFAQRFGFKGFKELQVVFQRRLATATPGHDTRIKALEGDVDLQSAEGMRSFLSDLVVQDMAALQKLLVETSEADLTQAVDLLERAGTIYLAGQLRAEPIVNLLRYFLTMLGRKLVSLDSAGGLASEMAKTMRPDDVLLATSFRPYAPEVVQISEHAAARGVPVIAISDDTHSPLAKAAEVLFSVPEGEYPSGRSLAAPMCLVQALMAGLASRRSRRQARHQPG